MKTCSGCIHRFDNGECVECVTSGLYHKNYESLEDIKRKAMNEAYDKVIEYIRNQDCLGYLQETKTEEVVNDILKLKGEQENENIQRSEKNCQMRITNKNACGKIERRKRLL